MTDQNTDNKLTLRCRPIEGNRIEMQISQGENSKIEAKLTPDAAVGFAASLLAATRVAGDHDGSVERPKIGETLGRTMGIDPSAIGLSQTPDGSSSALVLQFGSSRLGVKLTAPQANDLARALTELKR